MQISVKQGTANSIDAQVGARVRTHRRLLGMTQSDLGIALGVSFQQVQKYEKGTNRIGAGRLHDIASALRVPVSVLFDDKSPIESQARDSREHTQRQAIEPAHLTLSNEGLALARSFIRISDATLRRRVVRLVEQLSKATDTCHAGAVAFDETAAATRAGRSDSDRA
jgi:transcriptional regulator with XRE-family HTH domain